MSTMDRMKTRMERHYHASGWVLDHWEELGKKDTYEKSNGNFIPLDIREYLLEILDRDMADALTLALNWRLKKEQDEGVIEDD